jgi:hypothetical protein
MTSTLLAVNQTCNSIIETVRSCCMDIST